MSTKKKAIAAVKWTTLANMVTAISAILKMSILARFLDKDDFGLMAIITFVLGLMTLFMNMGLSSAILHKQDITREQYSSLYWINFTFSIVLFLVLVLVTPLISTFYEEPELNELIPIMGTALIFSAIGRQFKTIEEKELNFKYVGINEIVTSVVTLIFAVILAVAGYGVYALVLGALAKFVLSNIWYFLAGIRKNSIRFYFNYAEIEHFVSIGLYQVGGQVTNYATRNLDILLLGKLFGTETLGAYNLAKQLVFRPAMIINPILTRVAAPMLAKFQSEIEKLRSNYLYLIKLVASINFPIYLIILIFAPWVVILFYGRGYEDIVILVRILSVYMMVRAVGNPIGSLLIATGRTDLDFGWSIFSLIVMSISIYIGSQFSIVMVTIFMTVTMILLFVPQWWYLSRRVIDVDLWTYTKATIPDFHLLKTEFTNIVGKKLFKGRTT